VPPSFSKTAPYSPLKVNQRFGGTYRLHLQGRRISQARSQRESRWPAELCFAICCSETSVDFQRTTRRYIPEDGTLHNHRCENLKSYNHGNVINFAATFVGSNPSQVTSPLLLLKEIGIMNNNAMVARIRGKTQGNEIKLTNQLTNSMELSPS
jgi:hypothetical protein